MTVMNAVAELLWANAAFKAACPGGIMDTLLPEGATLPAVTYQEIYGGSEQTFSNPGLPWLRVQFDVHANAAADCDLALAALQELLEQYRGTLADGGYLQNAIFSGPIGHFDGDARQFRKTCEFRLIFNRSN